MNVVAGAAVVSSSAVEAARGLSYYLRALARSRGKSLAECSEDLLAPLRSEEARSLVFLTKTRGPEAVPSDYAWRVSLKEVLVKREPRYIFGDEISQPPMRRQVAETDRSAVGPAAVLAELARRWALKFRKDDDSDLDRFSRYRGPVGVRETDARRLWPELFPEAPPLRLVPSERLQDEAWRAAVAACKPPESFKPGQGWAASDREALLSQYEALYKACGKASAALLELHKGWGYAEPKGDKGGVLSKTLTKARAERKANDAGRRSVKAGG